MGVDITHIIKHNSRQTDNIQLSIEFAKKTIEHLKKACLSKVLLTVLNCSMTKIVAK